MADEDIGATADGAFDRGVLRRGIASAGALLLALLLVGLVVWVASSNRERDAAAALERQSFEAVLLTRNIDASIGQAEAALGRYVINSDRGLGTIYRDRWRRAGRMIDQLDRLVRDNPEQEALVAALRDAYGERGRELARTANYAAVRRNWEALSLHNQDGASVTGPRIARALDRIGTIERTLLEQRAADRRASTELSNLLVNLLAAAGVLFAIVAAALGWTAL
ncbi:MAG: CHASE3 domain-containing protein, partial [Sphingomonadaceae bacterium]|nr:CHASE3 domain-containing protein [Sphingomonadaceae bacterium]